MSISYTPNFLFPLQDTGDGNWGAGINGMLETVDHVLQEASDPLTWDDTELLIFDGEVLGWA